jgi:hypothetical protein
MREVGGLKFDLYEGKICEEYEEYERMKNETKKDETMMNDRRCHTIRHDSRELLSNDASLQRNNL